jgi:outer membrane protein insertion porin family
VAISPDKQDISITINITEGERFVVSGVKLEGNYLDKEDEFKSLVTIRARRALQRRPGGRNHQGVSDYFRQFWFAFARSRRARD